MSGRVPRLGGGVATVDTAGEGWFFGAVVHMYPQFANGGIFSGIEQTNTWQFVLPFRASVKTIVTEVTSGGGAGKKYGVGLYDVTKNLILETGALDGNTVQINVTTITQVILEPGIYWYAVTGDSTSIQLKRFDPENTLLHGIATPRQGTATNGSAGVLPATLGTITGVARAIPRGLFLPE